MVPASWLDFVAFMVNRSKGVVLKCTRGEPERIQYEGNQSASNIFFLLVVVLRCRLPKKHVGVMRFNVCVQAYCVIYAINPNILNKSMIA